MTTFDRPKQIIEYCLAPLALDTKTGAYRDAYQRLEHVVKTLQLVASKNNAPVAVDFSTMRTLTINEDAHGQSDGSDSA